MDIMPILINKSAISITSKSPASVSRGRISISGGRGGRGGNNDDGGDSGDSWRDQPDDEFNPKEGFWNVFIIVAVLHTIVVAGIFLFNQLRKREHSPETKISSPEIVSESRRTDSRDNINHPEIYRVNFAKMVERRRVNDLNEAKSPPHP